MVREGLPLVEPRHAARAPEVHPPRAQVPFDVLLGLLGAPQNGQAEAAHSGRVHVGPVAAQAVLDVGLPGAEGGPAAPAGAPPHDVAGSHVVEELEVVGDVAQHSGRAAGAGLVREAVRLAVQPVGVAGLQAEAARGVGLDKSSSCGSLVAAFVRTVKSENFSSNAQN